MKLKLILNCSKFFFKLICQSNLCRQFYKSFSKRFENEKKSGTAAHNSVTYIRSSISQNIMDWAVAVCSENIYMRTIEKHNSNTTVLNARKIACKKRNNYPETSRAQTKASQQKIHFAMFSNAYWKTSLLAKIWRKG